MSQDQRHTHESRGVGHVTKANSITEGLDKMQPEMTLQLIFIQCNLSVWCVALTENKWSSNESDILARLGFYKQTTHIHTHPFNGPLSGTTRVNRYQKGKTSLDFTEARGSEWQWHQLGHMQVYTSLQTDTTPASHRSVFYRPDALPAAQPTASKRWRQTTLRKKHTPLELNLQEHRKALLQKILLIRDLIIHVKARMLKSKPQNQGQGQSQGRTLTRSRPMTKKLVLTPRPRINMRGELWRR